MCNVCRSDAQKVLCVTYDPLIVLTSVNINLNMTVKSIVGVRVRAGERCGSRSSLNMEVNISVIGLVVSGYYIKQRPTQINVKRVVAK